MRLRSLLALAVLAGSLAACGGSSGSAGPATQGPQRPSSSAQLIILSPQPNQVVGTDPTLQFQLVGGTVVPAAQASGPLSGDHGHIHVSVDDQLVSMAYGLTQQLHGLKPGPHSLQAEFVAVDHLPFRNRVVARTLFTVQ